ncbi:MULTISPECIES: response regulator transcription factor [Clostridium]|uniref:Stage 0 sporulation protein A homolog n=1 Tax=Clostridium botulinum TaxID=1491 RepID=A0A6B4P2F2_CLOBO|nr:MULTISPECIES: response regulator transcription factor [Clostridium]EES49939.1 two component transcriptional regulator, winged helix family [Clostridium botulinum E1 str. 'BoNT E Beluga']MBN1043232.1 DNA-binding response regulator [Clostridium botulinum]MBY6759632.1 response regulator transcription factor [Clostridium botulinum]MBY6838534.1 response regulator transcription factor [Clostridium botulinum]MBY6915135.1 response regulator transcription factor [Clostridium botulinum]
MYKILIVEDDLTISSILKNHLCKWGYEAEFVSDFNNVVSSFIEYDPQLVVLDITLPFYNGFHWCTEIRKISKVPIIFASSASDNMNLIMAINMGADDFIAKPFDLNVIVAKVQALIRRTYSFQGQINILESNGAVLNLGDTTIAYNNKKLELSKNEFKILQILLENKNKAVSRDDIMTHLWNSDSFIDDNTLTVNVTRLRRKLEDINLKDFIKTKKGMGYIVGD